MGSKSRDVRHGYLKRMLYTYLAVLLIPLIFLDILVFRLAVDHARDLELKFTGDYVTRVAVDLDEEFNRMNLVVYDINDNLKIRASVLEDNPNNILTAQEFLDSYRVANQFFSDVLYYPLNGQTFYGSQSVYSFDTYARFFLTIPGIGPYDAYRRINAIETPEMIKWTDKEGPEKAINFHYVCPLDSRTDKESAVIFLIPYAEMSRVLGIDKDPPDFPLLLTDQKDRLIYRYVPPGHEDKQYIPLRETLKNSRWQVTALLPEDHILPALRKAVLTVALMTLAVILLEWIIIFLSLKLTYHPLRNLAASMDDQVSNVLETLEKGIHELQSTSESALMQLQREDFFRTLLHFGKDEKADEILASKAGLLRLEGKGKLCSVIMEFTELPLDSGELLDAYYEHLTGLLSFPLSGWFEPVTLRLICVVRTDGREKETIISELNEAAEQLFEEFALSASISMGEFCDSFAELKDSLLRVMQTDWDSFKNRSGLKQELEDFYHLIADRKREDALGKAEEIYRRLNDPEERGYITYRLFYFISESLPESHRTLWKRERSADLEKLSPGNEKDFIRQIIDESEEIRRELNKQSSLKADLLEEIMAYIDAHYLEPDFSVGALADHMKMSLSSVSLLFKRSRGIGIAAHVGYRRIEKAGEYLNKGFSVNEVVSMVGYSDPTSFIKKYKKITGRTPGSKDTTPR